jgi:hypothetical protein
MAKDIDIDEQALEEFITSFIRFQERIEGQYKILQGSWDLCDESWQSPKKEQFAEDFERTLEQINYNLQQGEVAIEWLRKFHEVIKEYML